MISIGIVVMFLICHLPRVCMMTFELINAEALTGQYRISSPKFTLKSPIVIPITVHSAALRHGC